jgi:RNA polymerase sigma factor (TIGR02999 family)
MNTADPLAATAILRRARRGDPRAIEAFLPLVHDKLHELALQLFRRERVEPTLQPTALVHEVYLRLIDGTAVEWNDRTHFFGIAARSLRQILVEHARRRMAEKRGRDRVAVTFSESLRDDERECLDLLDLDSALDELAKYDARKARVVELRFFSGLTVDEVASALGASPTTVERDWRMARAWLERWLKRGGSTW